VNHTKISIEKISAYEATHYAVGSGSDAFTLRIGEFSPRLKDLFNVNKVSCGVFITAFNPFGSVQSGDANETAHSKLRADLKKITSVILDGTGADPMGDWPPEASYLALGVEQETAEQLGRRFHQDAIVWSRSDAVPSLLFLR